MQKSMIESGSELRRLILPIMPHMGLMSLAIISEVLRQISGIGVAVLGAALFALAVSGTQTENLYPYAAGMIILGLARGSFGYLGPYLAHVAAYRILVALRDEFYRVIEPLAPARLSRQRTGDLVSTAVSDIEILELFFAHTAGPAVVAVVVPILSLTALAAISLRLAEVLLVFLILLALMPRLAFYLGSALGDRLREELALVNAQVLDSLQGMRDILAFGYGKRRLDELTLNSNSLVGLQARQAKNVGLQSAASVSIVSMGIIGVLLSASILVSRGELAQGYLPIAVILASSVFTSLMSVVEISKQLSQALAGARRLFRILDAEPAVKDVGINSIPGPVEPSVTFEHICFGYSPDGPQVLKDLSFGVPAGSTVALVGMSGAGKSTVISLLMRFWDPVSGKIMLGGRDLRSYPLQELRQHFSVVTQDVFLFNDTVRENIRLGRADATDSEVEEAAAKALIHDFILSLPQGYDTFVGERGIRLSGGERQRIAIARALLKDAHVLILDEATSSLDAETERAIKETLLEKSAGCTTIMVAHRLSTVVDADCIFVMKDGRVVESGGHEELLSLKGEYFKLVAAQSG
ncbi:MAG: Molybdate/tungstate import ATP-binding protein WtpC [Methanosaeta sp. PtaB.Bin018]|nr:MAG: Molybdate/tungstate import ATP-binding protein WtpC [Methanosaeta sp. PtaB.Bin018]